MKELVGTAVAVVMFIVTVITMLAMVMMAVLLSERVDIASEPTFRDVVLALAAAAVPITASCISSTTKRKDR